ncbi:GNAT family N-acetyltransferase [Paenibacillus sp. JX-17]|uniref:GNAT family N-acetyltransferase n=1 Tax=Paenibacillus lacisoli TaxID=3064525 RepID=A0ABT9CDX8_9BACL|nr:GNAT family N-acetyltransferase [Paenibacillus sp. JX-17]MDO7907461.1 GNAT family N-acetyltransferase [Paenibacillus sp. JX-17]
MSLKIREARPEDASGMAKVHVKSWQTTYKGIVPEAYLAELSIPDRTEMWKRAINRPEADRLLYVAEDEEGVIQGFVTGGPNREQHPDYQAELYAIYLMEEVQGQGLGRLLVERLAARLLSLGYTSMMVWALEENAAVSFYERLGAERVKTVTTEIGGKQLQEVGLGWKHISISMGA